MRSTRLTLAVTALSAALALTACSDDSGTDDTEPETQSTSTAEGSEVAVLECGSAVKVSGSAEASWSGKARPTETSESGHAVYESRSKQGRVVVTSAAEGEDASVELTLGNATYTASGEGIDAQADGTGAEMAVETSNGDEAGPRLIASFVCYESD